MKITVLLLVVFIGACVAEYCLNPGQCTQEQCQTGESPGCTSNICTCVTTIDDSTCGSKDDCNAYYDSGKHGSCYHSWRHCVDAKCQCHRY
ncbi:serine protease inhibitor Cvsi-2-like [Mya arenaria]|uniref:serine protease inhibitor Cvsi-2-like n=1 Tax=Mya arenaria TaxID=6604 RepID=UPI0022E250C5|nr:serine protease inhibitor Cvsi-2-like [Mya arenaria]